jgi:putative membrane protein
MKTLATLAALTLSTLLWSCNTSPSDSKEVAEETNEARMDAAEDNGLSTRIYEEDAEFAVKAADGGLTEVQLGQIALEKASDQKVKDFAKNMLDDHKKANEELKAIASRKDIALPAAPSEDHVKTIADISEKSGKDFDKAYVKQMVKDHEKTVELFEDAQDEVKDAEMRAFIDKTLPVLRQHLEHSKNLDKTK